MNDKFFSSAEGLIIEKKKSKKESEVKKSEDMNIIDKITSKTNNFLGKIKNIFEKKQDLPNHYTHVIVFDNKFRILLLKRSNNVSFEPGKWWLPGGHLDVNEEAMFGAQRELLEETNIDNIKLYFLHDSVEDNETHHTYGGVVLDDPLIVLDSTEHSNYMWVDPSLLSSIELLKGKQKQLEDLIKIAYNKLGYEVIKDAFEQQQVTEDQFLLALKRSQISN